jgi:hypothetical protein
VQKDFESFIGQGEQTQGRSWRLAKGMTSSVCEKKKKKKKGRRMSVRKIVLVLMCGEVLMERVCVRIKHGRRLCVANTSNNASKFFVQLVVPSKSTVGLVSKLNQS